MKTDYGRFAGMALDDPRLPTPAFVINEEKLARKLAGRAGNRIDAR